MGRKKQRKRQIAINAYAHRLAGDIAAARAARGAGADPGDGGAHAAALDALALGLRDLYRREVGSDPPTCTDHYAARHAARLAVLDGTSPASPSPTAAPEPAPAQPTTASPSKAARGQASPRCRSQRGRATASAPAPAPEPATSSPKRTRRARSAPATF